MLTDRQRWNWFAALNAAKDARRLARMNTASVCDGSPFLTPEERVRVEEFAAFCERLADELEHGQRSRPEDTISLITAAGTETYCGPTRGDSPRPAA